MMTVNSKRGGGTTLNAQINKNNSQIPDDFRSDFGGGESNLSVNNMSVLIPSGMRKFGGTDQQRPGNQTVKANPNQTLNKTTSRLNNNSRFEDQKAPPTGHKLRTNNLMAGSEKGDLNSQRSEKNIHRFNPAVVGEANERDRRLSQIANSVSGFYRGGENNSEHSVMRSTHESNFAQNLGQIKLEAQLPEGEERKKAPRRNQQTVGDNELDRIYGTARGLADFTMLSDWEKDSNKSKTSAKS